MAGVRGYFPLGFKYFSTFSMGFEHLKIVVFAQREHSMMISADPLGSVIDGHPTKGK